MTSYVPMIQAMSGLPKTTAQGVVASMLLRCKKEGAEEGSLKRQVNFGDYLLDHEKSDIIIGQMLANKRADGVVDSDIRWWWNMHDLERRMMLKVDDFTRAARFYSLKERGLPENEAACQVRRSFPNYGDPADTTHEQGEDRPLPFELKDRVNRWIERRSNEDVILLQSIIHQASSVNALIRQEINFYRL